MDLQGIQHLVGSNPFLTGGAALGVAGVIWNYCKTFPTRMIGFIRDQLTCSITVYERDESFAWIQEFLNDTLVNRKHFTAKTQWKGEPKVILLPGSGNHFGWFEGKPFWVSKDEGGKEPSSTKPSDGVVSFVKGESMRLSFFGVTRNHLQRFVEFVRSTKHVVEPDVFPIYMYVNRGAEWAFHQRLPDRELDSVILDCKIKNKIVYDIDTFVKSKDFYNERGIPYHRGYLLHGIPGGGKTSLVKAMAYRTHKSIYYLALASVFSDAELITLFSKLSAGDILLLEDIDCIFHGRQKEEKDIKISFSTLLNCLDGPVAKEGQIVFMTTNHKDVLDPALYRSGRIDHEIEFTYATRDNIIEIYFTFFPLGRDERNFAAQFEGKQVSLADVQEKLIDMAMREQFTESN